MTEVEAILYWIEMWLDNGGIEPVGGDIISIKIFGCQREETDRVITREEGGDWDRS